MCKCTPGIKTPYCGKGDCRWPAPPPREKNTMTIDGFLMGARDVVLVALDAYVREMVGHNKAMGARDEDLTELFKGIDAHMTKVAKRYNDPESNEPGSATFGVIFDES